MDSLHSELIEASKHGDIDKVQHLLTLNCNQLMLDSSLCWACRCGNENVLYLLLNAGANPNVEILRGFTPLIWAAMFSPNVKIILILIEAGSNINHCSSQRRQTPLHAAVIRGNHELVTILLEAGCDPDVRDFMDKTPLLHAVQRDSTTCAKLLVKYNCDVNLSGSINGCSMSPLVLALLRNNIEMIKILLLGGAKFQMFTYLTQTYTIAQYYSTVEQGLNFEVRPVYLQQQCRVCIRHLLKPHFLQKLQEMNFLPESMKEYLKIDELKF